jgi:hypothetical protein
MELNYRCALSLFSLNYSLIP